MLLRRPFTGAGNARGKLPRRVHREFGFLATGLVLGSLVGPPDARAAEFLVDTHVDAVDLDSKDLVCADLLGRCTLRAAVMQANAIEGHDHIFLPRQIPQRVSGFVLTIPGVGEPGAATGDLDLTDDVTIQLEPPPSPQHKKKGTVPKPPEPKIVDGNGLDRVFDVHPGATVVLQTLVIRGGLVPSSDHGAGIRNRGDLTLAGVVLSNNVGAEFGGGVSSAGEGAALHIQDSEICHNQAEAGGGVYSGPGASFDIHGSVVCENHAGTGGGVFNAEGKSLIPPSHGEIVATTVRSNHADIQGAGIVNGGTLLLVQSTVSFNVVVDPGPSPIGGGGILNTDQISIFDSTIASNAASGGGGGILSSSPASIVSLFNSTVRGNGADIGSGLHIASGANGTMVFVTNTILAGNLGDDCSIADDTLGAFILSHGGNLGTPPPFDTCPFDHPDDPVQVFPELSALQDNGGPTETFLPEPESSAVDAANDALCTGFDQRGVPRPQGLHCDVGAVERTNADSLAMILDLLADAGLLPGLENALSAKIDEADRSLRDANPANDRAGMNALGAFVRAVEAQRGLGIEETDADSLTNLASAILHDLQPPEEPRRR